MGLEFDGVNGIIKNTTSDGDVTIKGNDGGSEISLLAFDVSAEGVATFNSKVGIKDSAPDVLLHVNQGGEPPAEGMFILEANSASRQLRIQPPTNSDNGFIDYRGGNLTFLDDGTEVARFQGSTGFGIGTSTVNSKLEVAGNATITTADNTDTLSLISTDGDALVGPVLRLFRNSSSPADDDVIGNLIFSGQDGAGNETDFLTFQVNASDVANGAEDGFMRIMMPVASTSTEFFRMNPAGFVFNEGSVDMDFRVESNGNTHMLFVDGGNNRVGVGCDPSADFHVDSSGGGVIRVSRNGTSTSNFMALESDGTNGTVKAVQSLIISTGGSESMRVDTSGNLGIGTSSPINTSNYAGLSLSSTTGGIIDILDDGTQKVRIVGSGAEASIQFAAGNFNVVSGLSGGSTIFKADSTGAVTMPLQPAFLAQPSGSQNNLSNSDSVAFASERFDQNGDFASSTFTAPVTGKYQLNLNVRLQSLDTDANYHMFQLETSNRNYQWMVTPSGLSSDATYWFAAINVLADMDANDTADVHYYQSGGADQADIEEGGTSFSGFLAC